MSAELLCSYNLELRTAAGRSPAELFRAPILYSSRGVLQTPLLEGPGSTPLRALLWAGRPWVNVAVVIQHQL